MSDAGIPKPPTAVPPTQALPAKPDGQPARVQTATGQLTQVIRPLTIEGVITQHNNDGTVRIQTAQGNLDVQLRGQNDPPDGQRVEVDVAAGRPPRQAVVRPASDPPTPQTEQASTPTASSSGTTGPATAQNSNTPDQSQNQQQSTAGNNAGNAAPAPRLSDTVSSSLTQQLQQPAPPATPPQGTLQPGDDVRLLPLSPDQAAALDAGATNPVAPTATLPPLPATAAGTPPVTGLTTAIPPLLPTQPESPLLAASGSEPLPPLLTTGTAGSQTASSLPQITNLALSLTTTTPAVAHTLTAPVTAPTAIKPATTAAASSTVGRPPPLLDVRITAVTPAGATLTAPDAKVTTGLPAPNPFFSTAAKPAIPPTVTIPPQTAGSITATVTGLTQGGLPVVTLTAPGQSFPSHYVLQFNAANLQPGATIAFIPHVDSMSQATPALNNAAGPTPTYELLGNFQWPALDNIKSTLVQIDPQAAQTLTHILPAPAAPEQMPAAVMFFIAAVRSGDMNGWLGEKTIDALKRAGRSDAIDKLDRDMDGIAKLDSAPPNADDWRALPLPAAWGGDIQKMLLYYRQDRGTKDDGEEAEKTRGTRFIFDMSLTRMGAVQLDGLHRPGEKDSKLDMIVRTRTPLSQPMQLAMRRAYITALEQTGHSGEMAFQNRPEQWVRVDMAARGRAG